MNTYWMKIILLYHRHIKINSVIKLALDLFDLFKLPVEFNYEEKDTKMKRVWRTVKD